MGILDTIEGMVGGQGQGSNPQIAGGLMQALDEHPGGLGGVMDHFRQSGMDEHVQNWSTGQQTATPEQMQQGLGGTGFIESVAQKAGISPEMAKIGLATMLPVVMAHFAQGGQNPPQSGFGGMAGQVLGRFL